MLMAEANNNYYNSYNDNGPKKMPSIETLNSEMPGKEMQRERGKRVFKIILNRLRLKKYASATISRPDPSYRVAYLGNVVTGWAKGEGCVEKPLATLWKNYTHSSRPDVRMQLTVSGGGLKATTKDHGLTEYWAHRLTTCAAPPQFPRIFCWVYRHEGRRLRHELRCHAVLCSTSIVAQQIEAELKHSLALALQEFKRDKVCRQNARLSLVNSVYENPTIPRRKILLSTGSQNYKPPLERSKSAPKLTSIEEEEEDGSLEVFRGSQRLYKEILKHCDSAGELLDRRRRSYCLGGGYSDSMNRSGDDGGGEKRKTAARVTFDEEGMAERKSDDAILDELVQRSVSSDLVESCERAWFAALHQKPDLIPLDSDEGSLSSGCETASTATSADAESPFAAAASGDEEEAPPADGPVPPPPRKNEVDFKLGCAVLDRVRSFERIANPDLLKHCKTKGIVAANEEVSLVPVGECPSDFSSLKVFKKRCHSDSCYPGIGDTDANGDEEEEDGICSDESGYEDDELASSVANIVLV